MKNRKVGRKGVWQCGRELATVAVKNGRLGWGILGQSSPASVDLARCALQYSTKKYHGKSPTLGIACDIILSEVGNEAVSSLPLYF